MEQSVCSRVIDDLANLSQSLCHAVRLTFDSLTLNIRSMSRVTFSNSVPNLSKI